MIVTTREPVTGGVKSGHAQVAAQLTKNSSHEKTSQIYKIKTRLSSTK